MMAKETWLNADEAIEQGFADSKMFENDNMQIVASDTSVIERCIKSCNSFAIKRQRLTLILTQ